MGPGNSFGAVAQDRRPGFDAICALGVAATGAGAVIVLRLGPGGVAVVGCHGAEAEAGETVRRVPLKRAGHVIGWLVLCWPVAELTLGQEATVDRLRQVTEAQMAAEQVLERIARDAVLRIEAARV